MDFWNKMIFPVRRLCLAISLQIKPPKSGAGLLKLHNDVQTCGYQDVQVMWEMLQRSESDQISNNHNHNPRRKARSFWRVFVWSNNPSFASNHA